jgi:hypothetical protein
MLADIMRSCLVIMEDVLDTLPVLLYQVTTQQPRTQLFMLHLWQNLKLYGCAASVLHLFCIFPSCFQVPKMQGLALVADTTHLGHSMYA